MNCYNEVYAPSWPTPAACWAIWQPAALPDALEAVERISELLDLSGLFSALLLHPRRDRKSLSYTGGIQVSGLDFGFPCPYGALESKCGGAVFGQWRYATWGGLLAAVGAHAC